MTAPANIIGFRHDKGERECRCGCQNTIGQPGTLVQNSDTPKLKRGGLAYYDFPDRREPDGIIGVCHRIAEISA